MAARIEETDFGTKNATIRKIIELKREAPGMFDRLLFRYWQKVYSQAVREVPVDTAALRNSIRIQKGRKGVGRKYEVGKRHHISEFYIIAGGGGVINPKHKREVDYARAVHEGTARTPPNRFLNRAIEKTNKDLEEFLKKYMDWYAKTWSEDQPPIPATWSVNLPVSIGQGALERVR